MKGLINQIPNQSDIKTRKVDRPGSLGGVTEKVGENETPSEQDSSGEKNE